MDYPVSIHNTATLNMALFVSCSSVSVNVFVQYWQRDVGRNVCGSLLSYCAWICKFGAGKTNQSYKSFTYF